MPAFDFRQCLAVEVVVVEVQVSMPRDKNAAILPIGESRDELVWGGKLDIDIEFVLQCGNGLEKACGFRRSLEVNIKGRWPPVEEKSAGTASEIDPARATRLLSKCDHESPELFDVCVGSHGKAEG